MEDTWDRLARLKARYGDTISARGLAAPDARLNCDDATALIDAIQTLHENVSLLRSLVTVLGEHQRVLVETLGLTPTCERKAP